MAANPMTTTQRALRLEPFAPVHAPVVASWIGDGAEAYQLAPRTAPPIDAEKIVAWGYDGAQQFLLMQAGEAAPLGYGELSVLNAARREFWIGHVLINPQQRGEGLGTALARLLLHRAFVRLEATRVSLVVFPDNAAAIACYRAAGFFPEGFEIHAFPSYSRSDKLLRMIAQEWDG